MKRSVILNKIATIIINDLNNGYTCVNNKNTKKFANKILTALERKGMLPPIEPYRTEADLDLGIPKWEEEND